RDRAPYRCTGIASWSPQQPARRRTASSYTLLALILRFPWRGLHYVGSQHANRIVIGRQRWRPTVRTAYRTHAARESDCLFLEQWYLYTRARRKCSDSHQALPPG